MTRSVLLAVVLCSIATGVAAEVVDVTAAGFIVRHEVLVSATPDAAYRSVVADIGQWWNPQHSYSGDGANLSIDARAGGCFCEKLPGGGVEHMRVVFVAPGSMLRMTGGLGPLQGSGVAGSMTWRFIPAPPSTKIELTYSVGGMMPGGFDKIAPAVNAVLGEQVGRLKNLIDTGKAVLPK